MNFAKSAAVVVLAGSLAACQGAGDKEVGGTVVGAALGGLLGSQFGSGAGQLAATAAGVAIGGFIGNQVGQSLDRADQAYHQQANQQAWNAPTGTTSSWNNPQTGASGAVTPTSGYYRDSQGRPCRDMQHQVSYPDGSTENRVITECQNPDGTWEISS